MLSTCANVYPEAGEKVVKEEEDGHAPLLLLSQSLLLTQAVSPSPYFTDEKTEAWRGEPACPCQEVSHCRWVCVVLSIWPMEPYQRYVGPFLLF